MLWAYVLIYAPIILFVVAFLYETWLSFVRLKSPKKGRTHYVDATWEVTHTLLIFGVVMLLMLFTKSIDRISDLIFIPTFLAASALAVRAALYIYIFYVRTSSKISWVDWLFALSHVVSALLLVVVVLQASWFLLTQHPEANLQFIPAFLPGLALVLAICALPIYSLYFSRRT
ncbi:MAG: hypothetical protein H6797_03385 [Candidatus Nomurabacteria bacterium]|nr:MAG: hypothetical protein H6797_03385 [Candidatus Nomurabacteria bacterium]